jgi:manganese-dependent inorganic pyrophosphatase
MERRGTWADFGGGSFRDLVVDKDHRFDEDNHEHLRRLTVLEHTVMKNSGVAEKVLAALPPEPPSVTMYLPGQLKGAVFVGHVVTDLDSIAGSIGGAELYGGTPARASEVNSETQFALDLWKVPTPPPIEEVLKCDADSKICLVDHQQTSQMNPAIQLENVVGVIDHHALQSKTIVTDRPIVIDIRPWGSMSTIVAHNFLIHNRIPSKSTAGMLLCAILSDTLNLQGPTTTDFDRLLVPILAEISGVDNIQELAQDQFRAKSKELANLSAVALVSGDQKSFSFEMPEFKGQIGFGVIETTDDEIILARLDELLPELCHNKKDQGHDVVLLAIVNIVKLRSTLLLCGPVEVSLANVAFRGSLSEGDSVMDLGGLVSRKNDFIPAVTKAIKDGWTPPKELLGEEPVAIEAGVMQVDALDPFGRVRRRGSVIKGMARHRPTPSAFAVFAEHASDYGFTD